MKGDGSEIEENKNIRYCATTLFRPSVRDGKGLGSTAPTVLITATFVVLALWSFYSLRLRRLISIKFI